VRRRYQIDIVTARLLQLKHNTGEALKGHLAALTGLTYIPVLTEDAPQIAIAEKNGAGAEPSDKGTFFAEMGPPTCNERLVSRSAKTDLSGCSVDAAISGTKRTSFKEGLCSTHPLPQLGTGKFQIGGGKRHCLIIPPETDLHNAAGDGGWVASTCVCYGEEGRGSAQAGVFCGSKLIALPR
jgi:hypothetical protein